MKLTLPQQDVYFEQLMYPNEPIYNIGAIISIKGAIDFLRLNKAYKVLIDQHDAYRTIIHGNSVDVSIEYLEKHSTILKWIDYSLETDPEEKAQKYMQSTFKQAFDLSDGQLLHRFALIKISDSFYYLFSMYHHIITDGWGTSLMFQRLVQNYNELNEYGEVISTYPFSYAEFAKDDLEYLQSANYEKDKAYWLEKYQKMPDSLFQLITSSGKRNRSKRHELIVERSVYDQLENLAKQSRSSTFHVILGILFMYFGLKYEKTDFAIGLPVLNRGKAIFKKTVGLFMGVTAFRIELDFEETFNDLILKIKGQLRQDYRYQRFPLGKLINELGIFQEKDRLFNITLSYEKQDYSDHFLNTETKVVPMTHESERVALAVYIREFDASEDVKIDLDYNVNYFSETDIKFIADHLDVLIKGIVNDPDRPLSSYDYITNEERNLLLTEFNSTESIDPQSQTIFDYFEKQVKERSDQVAVFDTSRSLTYEELNREVEQIATILVRRTEGQSNIPIGVLMDRSVDLISIFLAIMKAGHVYIPLDPAFPEERLQYIIQHSGLSVLIGHAKPRITIPESVLFLENKKLLKTLNEGDVLLPKVSGEDTAYVIYTSGSTGNPKGVEIGHEALINFLLSMQKEPGIESKDLLYSVTTQSFDISILEFLLPLVSGAKLYMTRKKILENPRDVIKSLKALRPSIIQATPSFYQMLFNAGWGGSESLKVLCGGDLLSDALAGKLLNSCRELWNMYGPTETTIWSSIKKITQPKDAGNIGSPIANTQIHILNNFKTLSSIGMPGVVHISGKGLAKGYYKDEALTKQQFIENPFIEGMLMYDTGDLGKWNAQGEIEFLGRKDFQVKIRGFRIELTEIESRLNTMDAIHSSVVVAQQQDDQEAYLVAYVISDRGDFDKTKVIEKLQQQLPDYMVPQIIVPIEKFPKTANNKVDRKALSSLNLSYMRPKEKQVRSVSLLQRKLNEFFISILELNFEIGIHDSFFALGGHSLNAVKLQFMIEEELKCRISLKNIFENPTIAALADFLENQPTQQLLLIPKIDKQLHYSLYPAQNLLWLAAQRESTSIAYNMNGLYEVKGELDWQILEEAFLLVLNKYDILRSNFVEIAGVPNQKIVEVEELDFKIHQHKTNKEDRETWIDAFLHRPFDLENDLLFRVACLEVEGDRDYLIFSTHHLISDGWSLELLIRKVVDNYQRLYLKKSVQDLPLPFQFQDYVYYHKSVLKNEVVKNTDFWRGYLKSYHWTPLNPLNIDLKENKGEAAEYQFTWDEQFYDQINKNAVRYGCTVHTLLISAFKLLIYKLYDIRDICIGTLSVGRNMAQLEDQMGMFVKTLPLRTRFAENLMTSEYIERINNDVLKIDQHQDIPEEIQREIKLDVLFVLQTQGFHNKRIQVSDELMFRRLELPSKFARLPLLINIDQKNHSFEGVVVYNTSLWKAPLIKVMMLKFRVLLESLMDYPEQKINTINTDLPYEKKDTVDIPLNF